MVARWEGTHCRLLHKFPGMLGATRCLFDVYEQDRNPEDEKKKKEKKTDQNQNRQAVMPANNAIREHIAGVKLTAKHIDAGTNPTLTWGFCLEKFETETTRLLLLRLHALSASRLLSHLIDKP